MKEPRHSGSVSSSTRNSILRPVLLWSAPIRTSTAIWHIIDSEVSNMIRNLAKFKPHCTLPGTGPPSSLSESGFSRICPRSVTLVHMWFICMGSPKSPSQSKSREWCKTFLFPMRSFLTTYAGTPSATQVTTVCRLLPHRFFSFCHWPWTASSFTSTQYPGPTLWPQPYGHTAVSAVGPLSELSPVLISRTSRDACTVSQHIRRWYV